MSASVYVLYMGFLAKDLVREYTFSVREAGEEPRAFTLTIPNESFTAHLVRFQDAPDICSRRLSRELTASGNHPAKNHFRVTDAELEQYRDAHSTKSATRFPSHKSSLEK